MAVLILKLEVGVDPARTDPDEVADELVACAESESNQDWARDVYVVESEWER